MPGQMHIYITFLYNYFVSFVSDSWIILFNFIYKICETNEMQKSLK